MNDKEIIRLLDTYGHLRHNPSFPGGKNLRTEDIALLTLDDQVVKDAVRSLQQFDANMEFLSRKHHHRSTIFDGDIGPATQELLELPRCSCPDYMAAQGSGSWPAGCPWNPPRYQQNHYIRVRVNEDTRPQHLDWETIKRETRQAYAQMGLVVVYVPWTQGTEQSEVSVRWKPLSGSTIGLAWYNNGTCHDNVNHYLDPGYQASTHLQTILHMHELGHNNNLSHTRGGIMNPSILNVTTSWQGDPSQTALTEYFGGQPVSLEEEEEEEPTSDIWRTVVVKLQGEEYLLTPRPGV